MEHINYQTKLPNHSWNLKMPMGNHILHHNQLPVNPIWPSYPLQTPSSSTTSTQIPSASTTTVFTAEHQIGQPVEEEEEPEEELSAMKEILFKIAAMQPVDIDPATIQKPKRRNVRISNDPQSVAARHRRERISEKIRILQRLVPGRTKMDTASMLDEAIRYVKFLKRQIRVLQQSHHNQQQPPCHVDWQVTPNKPLVSRSSTSLEREQAGPGFTFSATRGNPLCFNHEGRSVKNRNHLSHFPVPLPVPAYHNLPSVQFS